ncbi:MAG: DUF2384 domain-containing protein [Candidatus Hydrogenedentes bacterium]|nr:DUF2384 domain-containing protein [Candidatus Hydrogenedentota bacterium]
MVRETPVGNYIGLNIKTPAGAVAAVKHGLPVSAAEALGQHLDIPIRSLSKVTNIPERTLLRRKREKEALKADESERVMRIGLLVERAVEVLGGLEHARQWLKTPNRALGGSTPLDYADTEPGAREVEALLGRLEHGVFS